MNFLPPTTNTMKAQTGMALLMCLLFLTALTLLGLSASADAILQHQLAANLRETERAKQAALTALSWAEDWFLGLEGPAPEPCTSTCADLKLHLAGQWPPQPELEDLSWWQTQGYEAGIDPLSGNRLATIAANSANPPSWVIEVVHVTSTQAWYRILARASGQTDKAISVIESTVTRSWPSDDNTSASATSSGRVSWRQLR